MGIKEFIAAVMGAYPHVRTPWTFNTYVGARGDIYYTANTDGISVVSPEPGRLDAWSVSHDDADTTFGKTLEEAVGLMHLRRIADS